MKRSVVPCVAICYTPPKAETLQVAVESGFAQTGTVEFFDVEDL